MILFFYFLRNHLELEIHKFMLYLLLCEVIVPGSMLILPIQRCANHSVLIVSICCIQHRNLLNSYHLYRLLLCRNQYITIVHSPLGGTEQPTGFWHSSRKRRNSGQKTCIKYTLLLIMFNMKLFHKDFTF